jgi:hypothetical protein
MSCLSFFWFGLGEENRAEMQTAFNLSRESPEPPPRRRLSTTTATTTTTTVVAAELSTTSTPAAIEARLAAVGELLDGFRAQLRQLDGLDQGHHKKSKKSKHHAKKHRK